MAIITQMNGVREYNEGLPVRIVWADDVRRFVIEAFNQDGDDSVKIDLTDLVHWLKGDGMDLDLHEC